MRGDAILDEERLVRYCKPSSLDQDDRPSAASFMLRPGEEYISVFLMDRFPAANDDLRVKSIREKAHGKLMTFAQTAKLAVLGTGDVRSHVNAFASDHRWLRILHEPVDVPVQFDEHGGIYDTSEDEAMIAELIAERVQNTYPALDD